MTDAIADFLAGRLSAEAALAGLALSGLSAAQIADRVEGSPLQPALEANRGRLDRLATMLREASVDHDTARDPQAIASMFDRAVRSAPEASVAAYTLGDPALLARATAEIVDWLLARGLLQHGGSVLDLGCGIGRVSAALSFYAGHVLGLDVSPAMIAEARQRHGGLPNVRFEVSDGGPPELEPDSLDLVLAVDSFPYLVQAGVADAHVASAARLLRPGGVLAILNLSYGDPAQDEARVRGWASQFPVSCLVAGLRPFSTWDGAAFVLQKQAVLF